ncbi:hypothetical protein [Sphaerisporangium sp. TRM90804]|uniref:hypothetical protein n=1 Tax=Sphaerisporangium sp. TRM90804 TaxID=3031113 RepID=UPI00244786EE|nr:hypothetical protein [Sphaerisporangium sp. TRM90804]MDH2424783.1 hypothetical protein [Sphaerisporangium sp. TRM90804]
MNDAERWRDRALRAEATVARVDAAHQPRQATWYRRCPAHLGQVPWEVMDACPDCVKTYDVECSSFHCLGWPCHVHTLLWGETEDTCVHRAGDPAERT